jgi:hypothetical protein
VAFTVKTGIATKVIDIERKLLDGLLQLPFVK